MENNIKNTLIIIIATLIVAGCITVLVVKENSSFTIEKKGEVELPDVNIGNSTKIDTIIDTLN